MTTSTVPKTMRRSSRVPLSLPLHVTSLEPNPQVSTDCETLVVNAHGCAVRSPVELATGISVHFQNSEGRQVAAHIVDCYPLGKDRHSWLVAACLDEPENFWGVKPCPEDWMRIAHVPGNGAAAHGNGSAKARKGHEPVSEDRVRALLGEIYRPLHEEVIQLRERLNRPEAKRSSFEVSLSQIPPELEEQLWQRLRKDLAALALKQATEQSERVLETAKSTIGQSLTTAKHEFRQHLKEELQLVVVRAQRLSDEIDDGVRQQLQAGLEAYQQQTLQASTRVEERTEELFRSLQQKFDAENERRLREVEQVRAAIEAESAAMQSHVADLGLRVQALANSAQRLESELDDHLSQLSIEIITEARTELQDHAETILSDLQSSAARELANQIEAAGGRLKTMETGIETSVTELLNAQATRTMQSFEHSLDEQAGQTVVRWRSSLARDLTNVAKILGNETKSGLREEN